MHRTPLALVILDGVAIRPEQTANAVALASTPTFAMFAKQYGYTTLCAHGTCVGLPADCVGNSQVGHATIGAGMVFDQPLTIVNNAIADKSLFKHPLLYDRLTELRARHGTLHIIGLLSDGMVHSSDAHLFAYLEIAHHYRVSTVVHAITDGRDVIPARGAARYLQRLQSVSQTMPDVRLGSLHGRFYAMDRDTNWDRTERSYQVLATGRSDPSFDTWQQALEYWYNEGLTDEFIPPTALSGDIPLAPHDGVLFFNVRAERMRQLAAYVVAPSLTPEHRTPLPLAFCITPFVYDRAYPNDVLFSYSVIPTTLKKELSAARVRICSIAETEKYAHITSFFNGQDGTAVPGEDQILIPSLKLRNYTKNPCMSAQEITDAAIERISAHQYDFYLINYANGDMVGHSGDLPATIKAVECLDEQIKQLYQELVINQDGILIITADHGNAEDKTNNSTSHTANPVPLWIVSKNQQALALIKHMHELADVAPAILKLFDVPIPLSMQKPVRII